MEKRGFSRREFILGTAAFLIRCSAEVQEKNTSSPPEPSIPELMATTTADFEQRSIGPELNMCFEWPVTGVISSYFGPTHPLGIDIDTYNNRGQDVKAALSGKIIFSGGKACCSYGLHVVLEHENEVFTLYAHMSRLNASIGDVIKTGQSIGVVGSTGYSTGEHLHFEIMKAKKGQLDEARRKLRSIETPTQEREKRLYSLYYYNPLIYLRERVKERCPAYPIL